MQRRRKGFDPFDHAMDTVKLTGGVAVGNMLVSELNNQTGNHIDTGPAMNMLGMLPTLHASQGVLLSLKDMQKKMKR